MNNSIFNRPGSPRLALRAAVFALVLALLGFAFREPARADGTDPAGPGPVTLGEKIFHDPSLSASGAMACATCHDPAHAHAQSNGLAVQPGGPSLDVPGFRAVPSLRYLSFAPPFAFDAEGTPSGGFNRDGRAKDLIVQAQRPLFAPHEMANATPADLVARLAKTPYADEFRQVFGRDIFVRRAGERARSDVRAGAVPEARSRVPAVRLEVRPLPRRPAATRAGRAAWARALQPCRQGQLRRLSSERARLEPRAAALHRLQLRQPRRPAQSGHSGDRRSGLRRPRPVWPRSHRPLGSDRSLRRVQGADAAQRRHAQGVLPQRPFRDAARGAALLRAARHEPRGVLSPRRDRRGAEVRRSAARARGERQHERGPVRPRTSATRRDCPSRSSTISKRFSAR